MASEEQIEILDGPSKFDLMIALFGGIEVKLTLRSPGEQPEKWTVQITGIEIEDSSSQSWLLLCQEKSPGGYSFKGRYDSRTRTGWLRLKS